MTLSPNRNLLCHKVNKRIWHQIHWIPVVRNSSQATEILYYVSMWSDLDAKQGINVWCSREEGNGMDDFVMRRGAGSWYYSYNVTSTHGTCSTWGGGAGNTHYHVHDGTAVASKFGRCVFSIGSWTANLSRRQLNDGIGRDSFKSIIGTKYWCLYRYCAL